MPLTAQTAPDDLRLDRDGAVRMRDALDAPALLQLQEVLGGPPADQAGVRMHGVAGLDDYLRADGVIGALAAAVMDGPARPVRAILFDKTAATNWSLGWHQDRVVAVRERIEVPGFGHWSRIYGASPNEAACRSATIRVYSSSMQRRL